MPPFGSSKNPVANLMKSLVALVLQRQRTNGIQLFRMRNTFGPRLGELAGRVGRPAPVRAPVAYTQNNGLYVPTWALPMGDAAHMGAANGCHSGNNSSTPCQRSSLFLILKRLHLHKPAKPKKTQVSSLTLSCVATFVQIRNFVGYKMYRILRLEASKISFS